MGAMSAELCALPWSGASWWFFCCGVRRRHEGDVGLRSVATGARHALQRGVAASSSKPAAWLLGGFRPLSCDPEVGSDRKAQGNAETTCLCSGKRPCLLPVPSCVTLGVQSRKARFGDQPQPLHQLTPSSPCSSVDNSEYMRNGDFLPTRLQAQQDAVNIVCHSKTRSNPENNVGLITLAKYVERGGELASG